MGYYTPPSVSEKNHDLILRFCRTITIVLCIPSWYTALRGFPPAPEGSNLNNTFLLQYKTYPPVRT